jgi:hypothetical protein
MLTCHRLHQYRHQIKKWRGSSAVQPGLSSSRVVRSLRSSNDCSSQVQPHPGQHFLAKSDAPTPEVEALVRYRGHCRTNEAVTDARVDIFTDDEGDQPIDGSDYLEYIAESHQERKSPISQADYDDRSNQAPVPKDLKGAVAQPLPVLGKSREHVDGVSPSGDIPQDQQDLEQLALSWNYTTLALSDQIPSKNWDSQTRREWCSLLMKDALLWCRKKLLDSTEEVVRQVRLEARSPTCESHKCIVIAQLFAFFSQHDDLVVFQGLMRTQSVALSAAGQLEWITGLMKYAGSSLDSIVRTLSMLITIRSWIPVVPVAGWSLRQAAIDCIYILACMPECEFSALTEQSFQNGIPVTVGCHSIHCRVPMLVHSTSGKALTQKVSHQHDPACLVGGSPDSQLLIAPLSNSPILAILSSAIASAKG